jgi:hypothetical protein
MGEKNTKTELGVIGKVLCLLMEPISLPNGRKTIVRRTQVETLRTGHQAQTVKHRPKETFWDILPPQKLEASFPIKV